MLRETRTSYYVTTATSHDERTLDADREETFMKNTLIKIYMWVAGAVVLWALLFVLGILPAPHYGPAHTINQRLHALYRQHPKQVQQEQGVQAQLPIA
jgi:hypothetical protein